MSVTAMAPQQAEKEETGGKKKGKKKLFLIVGALVVLLGLGGAGYWFFLKPAGGPPPPPQPGAVVKLDPIQINLEGGHYLRIGIALQMTSDASEVDGSKALDATISLFSGRSMVDLANTSDREGLKKQLAGQLSELYDGKVMGVYFTDFVTQ
jgi:flagellar FliL protein